DEIGWSAAAPVSPCPKAPWPPTCRWRYGVGVGRRTRCASILSSTRGSPWGWTGSARLGFLAVEEPTTTPTSVAVSRTQSTCFPPVRNAASIQDGSRYIREIRDPSRSFTHLDRRILPGCSQQQGVIDHVRLQPPLCRIASSTRGRQASLD